VPMSPINCLLCAPLASGSPIVRLLRRWGGGLSCLFCPLRDLSPSRDQLLRMGLPFGPVPELQVIAHTDQRHFLTKARPADDLWRDRHPALVVPFLPV